MNLIYVGTYIYPAVVQIAYLLEEYVMIDMICMFVMFWHIVPLLMNGWINEWYRVFRCFYGNSRFDTFIAYNPLDIFFLQ